MKSIFILWVISIAILACGDSDDNGSPIIHRVVTPEPVDDPSDFPEVPEGFPEDLTPVWLKKHFDEQSHSGHVIMYRVLIELWNQGDHDFVNAVLANGKVYPLYPDVVYVEWDSHIRKIPDGESIEVLYISGTLGTPHATSKLNNNLRGKVFNEAEMKEVMAGEGAFMAKHPGLKLVDYNKAGHKPKDVLVDYCNQPGNRARVPYCR